MKKILFYTVLTILCVIAFFVGRSMAITFDWETQEHYHTSGPYAWWSSYDIGYFDDIIHVDLDISLRGWQDPARFNYWETGSELLWMRSGYDINIDFVDTDYNHSVWVTDGVGRADMLNWYSTDSFRVISHEIGHMFGLFDEYLGGALDPVTQLIDSTGLMGNLRGIMKSRYYAPFDDWLANKFAAINIPPDENLPGYEANPVPEPTTIILVGTGILGIAAFRRRRHGNRGHLSRFKGT